MQPPVPPFSDAPPTDTSRRAARGGHRRSGRACPAPAPWQPSLRDAPSAREHVVCDLYPLREHPAETQFLVALAGVASSARLHDLAHDRLAARTYSPATGHRRPERGAALARALAPARWSLRDPWPLEWPPHTDALLRARVGRRPLPVLAYLCGRTEAAVAYRARVLGLREVPRVYELAPVAAWLGLPTRVVRLLATTGRLEVLTYPDTSGGAEHVTTRSLAALLSSPGADGAPWWTGLPAADPHFCRDIVEGASELAAGAARWTASPWASHAGTSLNPYSPATYGLLHRTVDPHARAAASLPWDLGQRLQRIGQ